MSAAKIKTFLAVLLFVVFELICVFLIQAAAYALFFILTNPR